VTGIVLTSDHFVDFSNGTIHGSLVVSNRFGQQLKQHFPVRGRSDDSRVKNFRLSAGINLSEIENHLVFVVTDSKNIRVSGMQEFRLHIVQRHCMHSDGQFGALILFNSLRCVGKTLLQSWV